MENSRYEYSASFNMKEAIFAHAAFGWLSYVEVGCANAARLG
jgi:hypothetical protein